MRLRRMQEKAEIPFYNDAAGDPEREQSIVEHLSMVATLGGVWATPVSAWIDNPYDSVAQTDVYLHVKPMIQDGVVLQLGGSGKEAIKALLGGASQAYLVSPVPGEVRLATQLADHFGLASQFRALSGIGEDVPLPDGHLTAIISGGSLHHTNASVALVEARRLLTAGGRFGAWDPWHARLYNLGIALFGKREPGIECRPLNLHRVNQLSVIFPESEIRLHGALTRYPALALSKFGITPPLSRIHRMTLVDDRISRRVGMLRRNGSSVAVLAVKN
jgi:hypothetical protein